MALPKRLLDGYANFRKGRYASESERYLKLGEGAAETDDHDDCLLRFPRRTRNHF